ncbi:hypothetical protein IEO21_10321 [Rhodonia placenta]|uniref:Uncharacterized protein n=1 Tax=Rhodonia placenta TaxID=104341 RepID=A0A8H7NSU2_9APHY|nr:hypothetical protein IEO21_10321 [Postia placenta]
MAPLTKTEASRK